MKTDVGTLTRVVLFILAWINQILANYDLSPIQASEENINDIITGAISVWLLWKNNNFTHAAQEGQQKIHEVKSGKQKTGSPLNDEDDLNDI